MTETKPFIPGSGVMNRLVNPIVVRLGLSTVLTVRGRRSGKLISVPLGAPLEFEGARYLVSGRGETHWVRNLRAAGCGTLRTKRGSEDLQFVEIDGPERDRVVAAYRTKLGRSVDRYFARIPDAADHPVFRIQPQP